jgi:lipid-A-disaccharide synthase
MTATTQPGPCSAGLDVFVVAAEESGDRLGAALMRALKDRCGEGTRFSGVGGREMAAEGLASLYPIDDLALIGIAAIPARLAKIVRLIRFTANAIVARQPQLLVIIDSPDFTCRIARRVRAADASIPIVEYVSPSVWAWRAGRARALRGYVDHIMALLPFEPAAHARLGGPPCTYVGHPLAAEVGALRPDADEARRRLADPPVLLVLPGSRRSEIERHAGVFGATIGRVAEEVGAIEVIVPVPAHLREQLERATASWPARPRIVVEETEKRAAFRGARAALAKSGTVTLELALSGVPMVVAYRLSWLEGAIGRRIIKVPSVVLANLVLEDNVVPEFLQERCTAENLAQALLPLFSDTPQRRRQVAGFARLDAIMEIGKAAPAQRAADIVLDLARRAPARR